MEGADLWHYAPLWCMLLMMMMMIVLFDVCRAVQFVVVEHFPAKRQYR